MESQSLRSTTSTIDIYIKLAQYPILADAIRERMRQEIFKRGIIDEATFESEVEQLALESQRREGVHDPFGSEPPNIWHRRKARIRAFHTDFYFGYNLPAELFENIIQEVLSQQPERSKTHELAFNPEVAPWSLLFKQGEIYEALPEKEREKVSHHLEEIKVVLIKSMISDQLPYIGVAKKVFTVSDLRYVYERRIGEGKIGGKAAGGNASGITLVGERGPELVDFGQGARVYNNPSTRSMMGGSPGAPHITISTQVTVPTSTDPKMAEKTAETVRGIVAVEVNRQLTKTYYPSHMRG